MSLLKRSTKEKTRPGKLIVIDGIDGAGKTTQFDLLKETLELSGYKVKTIKFPRHGQQPAYAVNRYLEGDYGPLNAHAASIFYAVDRFDASSEIKQWLADGYIVLVDRYVTSNAGHHGGKIEDKMERLKFFKWLNDLEHNIFNIPRPDLTIILHVPAGMAQSLITKKKGKKDMHESDLQHLKNAERVFLEIAKLYPNTKLVKSTADGRMLTPKRIHGQVWELVRRIALRDLQTT